MSRARETAYRDSCFEQARGHGLRLLGWAAFLNTLFIASDLRFVGTPHLALALGARTLVIFAAILCLALLRRTTRFQQADLVLGLWMALTGLGVSLLVTSHSIIAMFVVILLPVIFFLVLPVSFRIAAAGGVLASIALLIGYGGIEPATAGGLAMALITLDVAMLMGLHRQKRLARLHWWASLQERRVTAELASSETLLEQLFSSSPVAMVVIDRATSIVLRSNDEMRALLGGVDPSGETLARFYADEGDRERLVEALDRDARLSDVEMRVRLPDGGTRTVLIKASAIETPRGRLMMAGVIDISDRKAVEMSLEWLASTDPLTGLPNRLSFFSTARIEIMRAARAGTPLSLLMLDLDHFKQINDGWGHQAGDRVLKAFSGLCLEVLREEDIIGRLGGEEFGVLLPGLGADAAVHVAELLRVAASRVSVDGLVGGRMLSTSIGVSTLAPGEPDLDRAIARADRALYEAKRLGRDRIVVDRESGISRAAG